MSRSRTLSRRILPAERRVVRALLASSVTAAITMGAPSAASAAVTCDAAEGFSRLSAGSLYLLKDPTLLDTANSMVESGQFGSGWGSFAWTAAAGDGVIYALTTAGKLIWYRWDSASRTWAAGSGAVIGTGFTPRSRVVNIAVGADGWIYTVKVDRTLVAYQHLGRLTGAVRWANDTGYVLGSGWTADELIAPQGDGVVYRQVGGSLFWYRHSDPTAGRVTWNNAGRGVKIGSGWRFYDLLPLGGGVLLATAAPSGQVTVWQHADPAGGGQGWVVTGRAKYVARPDSFGISFAPGVCG